MRIVNNTKQVKTILKMVAQSGVRTACHKTMAYANSNEVPMDTGRLINSGYYEPYESGNVVSYKLSYGGSEGLAGKSQFAGRIMEHLEGNQDGKYSTKPRNAGIYTKGRRSGQLTYAIHWHQNTPLNGFQNDRKNNYLADPMETQFPIFLIDELQKSFGSLGLMTNAMSAPDLGIFVPDEVF